MTQEEQIQTLYNWVQYLNGKVLALDKEIKELKAQPDTTAVEKSAFRPEDNALGITVDDALKALDWSVSNGIFRKAMTDFYSHFNKPNGNEDTSYLNIKNRITGTPTKPGELMGSAWLNYWSYKYRSKEGTLAHTLGAYFMKICAMWKEANHV